MNGSKHSYPDVNSPPGPAEHPQSWWTLCALYQTCGSVSYTCHTHTQSSSPPSLSFVGQNPIISGARVTWPAGCSPDHFLIVQVDLGGLGQLFRARSVTHLMVQKLPGGVEFGLDQRAGVTTVTGSAPFRLHWIILSLHKGSKMAKLSKQRLQFFMNVTAGSSIWMWTLVLVMRLNRVS